jgi:uncharacterized protein YqeY
LSDYQEHTMPLRVLLRADLKEARRANDSEKVTLIRTLIGAIDNAEAVNVELSAPALGCGEVLRRRLSGDEILQVVHREAAELRAAAEEYEQLGQSDEANRLRSLALVVDRYAEEMS